MALAGMEGPATRALWKGADKRPGGTSAAPPLRPRDDHSRWNFPLLFAVMWCLVARTLLLLLGLLPAAAGYTCFPPRCCSRSCAARARPLLLQQRGVPEGGDATLDVQDLKVPDARPLRALPSPRSTPPHAPARGTGEALLLVADDAGVQREAGSPLCALA